MLLVRVARPSAEVGDAGDPAPPRVAPVSALSSTASPLACAWPRADTLMSRLTIVPFCVVPLSTHAGCGWSAGGAFAAGTGTIPSADKDIREDTGRWTGMGAMVAAGAVGVDVTGVVAPEGGTETDADADVVAAVG